MSASKAAMAKEIRELREELAATRQLMSALVEHFRPEDQDGPWWPLDHEKAPEWWWLPWA